MLTVLIHRLTSEGVPTNVTALMSKEQVLLAILAAKGNSPSYVSLLFNRIIDGYSQPEEEIRKSRTLLDSMEARTQIIIGSIRKGEDVYRAMMAGAPIVTVTPKVVWEMVNHPQTERFIKEQEQSHNDYMSSRVLSQVEVSRPRDNNH